MPKAKLESLQAKIAELVAENNSLKQRLHSLPEDAERLLDEWLIQCSNANSIEALDLVLGEVCFYLGAYGATLTLYDQEKHSLKLVSGYPIVGADEKSKIDYTIEDYPWTWQQLLSGQPLILNSLNDIPSTETTDLVAYKKLDQPASLQILVLFERRPQSLLEFHSQGQDHIWRNSDANLIKALAAPFFSAANRIIEAATLSDGLLLLHNVIRTTGVAYGVFNQQQNHFHLSFNMHELLDFPAELPITPQLLDTLTPSDDYEKKKRWWKAIFQKEEIKPLYIKMLNGKDLTKYFCCRPSIIKRNQEGAVEKVLIGYTDITSLQGHANNLQWLSDILQKLHKEPSQNSIKLVLENLLKYLKASGILIIVNKDIVASASSSDAIIQNILGGNKAIYIHKFSLTVCEFIAKHQKIYFNHLENAPEEIMRNIASVKAANYIKLNGLYGLPLNHKNDVPAYIIIDWDKSHPMPEAEVIEAVLYSIGDAILTVLDQIRSQQLLEHKLNQEQWLTQQIDSLYRSPYPIKKHVKTVLIELCHRLQADRIFIRHRLGKTNTYRLSYEYCQPDIPSIIETVGFEVDLNDLPAEHILKLGKPQAINDMRGNTKEIAAKKRLVFYEDPVKATLMMPLFGMEGISAYIAIDCLQQEHHWSGDEQYVAQAIGDAICMTHARQDIYHQLANSEQRFTLAMNASKDGIWDWQLDCNEIYLSPGCLTLLGFTAKALSLSFDKDKVLGFIHDEDKTAFIEELHKLNQNQVPFNEIRLRLIQRSGKTIHCYFRAQFTEWDTQNNPKRVIGVITDVSEFVEQQIALDYARIEAEFANIEKNDFLARMSHEIRTPMNAIIGLSHLFKDTSLNELQEDYIDHIHVAAKNLLGIINDILDYSKIEASKLSIENIDFDFLAAIQQNIRIASFLGEKKSINLKLEHDPKIPGFLCGDSLRLSQIMTNLLSNAVKFTDHGEVIVKTQLLKQTTDSVSLQIQVIDSGIGISEDYIATLFEPFSQADGSISRRFGGTGLGLSIVQRLAQLMGGSIEVNSKLNQGTTFTLKLEFQLAQEQIFKQEHEQVNTATHEQLKGISVLIAEDNVVNQKVAEGLLKKKGVTCHFANNGQEAIDFMQSQGDGIAAILMDIEMPEVNGYQASTYIRQNLNNNIPIIAMTAHTMLGDEEKAINSGMVAHISKPIDPSKLYDTLAKFVVAD